MSSKENSPANPRPQRLHALLVCALTVSSLACATAGDGSPPAAENSDRMAAAASAGFGSAIGTIIYAPIKLVYAVTGSTVGGLVWLFSGGDVGAAERVIEPAVCGDYVVSSEHLLEARDIEFFGACGAETQFAAASLPAVSAPGDPCATIAKPHVNFDIDRATLDTEARRGLDDLSEQMRSCPDLRIHVEGYADATGSAAHNMDLSKRRASSVRDYLVQAGVADERVSTEGFGPNKPVASNKTAQGRAANRRVQTTIRSY